MTTPPEPARPRPLSTAALLVIASVAVVLAACVAVTLLLTSTRGLTGAELATARFETTKIALSLLAGVGAMVALYLAWRRQRSTEDTLGHQYQVAADTKLDATERRVTELYTKAVEQLGSDKAPVRLGGLYALERLAADYARQRQTIVNVFCAYLRMPYDLSDTADDPIAHRQEREVRITAQRILRNHLRPGPEDNPSVAFWPNTDIDLSGATLIDFDFSRVSLRGAKFEGAVFSGSTHFTFARFLSGAWFSRTRFQGLTLFRGAVVTGVCLFDAAHFSASVDFTGAEFSSSPEFTRTTFAFGVPSTLLAVPPDSAEA